MGHHTQEGRPKHRYQSLYILLLQQHRGLDDIGNPTGEVKTVVANCLGAQQCVVDTTKFQTNDQNDRQTKISRQLCHCPSATERNTPSPDTLHQDKVAPLEQMLGASKIRLDEPQKYFDNGESTYNRYTCGLKRWNVESIDVWGHTGFWGVGMFYIPQFDVCIVQASNQVESDPEADMKRVVSALSASGFFN